MSPVLCRFSALSHQFNHMPVFCDLSATLHRGLTGLVGRNGQGKSVLLSLLAQHYPPDSGQIQWFSPFHAVPQINDFGDQRLVDTLGVGALYDCFQRIESGQLVDDDFARTEGQWHLPALWQQQLADACLDFPLDTPTRQLSGGQQTRLLLCRAFLQTDAYLLLDEPSNHLDQDGRQWLFRQLHKHTGGALVASHDRQLLQQADRILAFEVHGLQEYGGNYDLYRSVCDTQQEAAEQQQLRLQREQQQQKRGQQAALEKAARRTKQGKQLRRSGSQSKLLLDARQQRAEGSLSTLKQQHQQRSEQLNAQLQQANEQLELVKPLSLHASGDVARSGICLHMTEVQLPYVAHKPLSLTLQQGERWQVLGLNGAGKSTLLRIVAGLERAQSGTCDVKGQCVYLDQHFRLLDSHSSALENLLRLHPDYSETALRSELAGVRLRQDKALQSVSTLSGGERLKVALLAVLLGEQLPALLLLDEPDNHLDLDSRRLLEQTLRDYPGALLVVSHDPVFIEALDIQQFIELG